MQVWCQTQLGKWFRDGHELSGGQWQFELSGIVPDNISPHDAISSKSKAVLEQNQLKFFQTNSHGFSRHPEDAL